MASNSSPSQWQKGDLWDTDPNTFVAREAVKRLDLSKCYLSDDAIMKFLVNKREKTIRGPNISRFNETEFVKGGFLRSRHKGKGAPALAPDGTVMTVIAGAHHSSHTVLNGGDRSLPVGDWSLENYQAKSDHPGYKEWLVKIKWTSADAMRAGIPLASINATLTTPAKSVQQNPVKSEKNTNELQKKEVDSPQYNKASILTTKGQLNNIDDLIHQGHERVTPTRLVTPQEVPQEVPPSEYDTLPSTYSGITTPHLTTPRSSFSGPSQPGVSASESSEPVFELTSGPTSRSDASQPVNFGSMIAELTTLEPAIPEHATSERIIPEPVASDLATSEPAPLVPVVSGPDTSDLAAFHPVTSSPTTSDSAVSEPSALELTTFESPTSELAVSEPVVSRPIAPGSAYSQPVASKFPISESAALKRSTSVPIMAEPAGSKSVCVEPLPIVSRRAASEPTPMGYFPLISIQAEINPPEAPKPYIMQSQVAASVQKQSTSPGPAFLKLISESTLGLNIDSGLMGLTTPKTSVPTYRRQLNPRQPSLEIPETPPPPAHCTVHSHISQESTQLISPDTNKMSRPSPAPQAISTTDQAASSQIISPVASRIKHSHATLSDARSSPASQPVSTINQAASFQSPPPTPVSKGFLKRKAPEPL